MNPRARRLVAPWGIGLAAMSAVGYLAAVDPNEPGHYPLCPTKALTGLDCPGCGGLRAVHSLTHLDAVGGLGHNALVVLVVIPLAVFMWVRWSRAAWRGGAHGVELRAPWQAMGPALTWSLVGVILAFTVARNIGAVPVFAWLGSTAS